MGEAFNILARSKDPSTQVGARIVSANNEPMGTGYNGPPKRIDDYEMDWRRPAKYAFIRHAEVNAIKYSCGDLTGATIYVTAPPCPACMLAIVDAEIDRVVYFPPPPARDKDSMTKNADDWKTTQDIARAGGVKLEKFSGDLFWMLDHVEHLKTLGIFDEKILCTICHKPIEQTGTAFEGRPCHTACYHKATMAMLGPFPKEDY